jgi:hypothetical protein
MRDEEPTLKNIAKEFVTPGYWNRARQRQKSSKTIWDLVFLPVGFAAIGGYWFAFSKLFLWIHTLLYPADVSRMEALTGSSLTFAQALIFLVPGLASIPLGLMTGNVLMWLVPPARRASERKAQGVKWAGFREAQRGLFNIGLLFVSVMLVLGIIGAAMLGR